MTVSRRQFLATAAVGTLSPFAAAIDPIKRPSTSPT